MQRTFTPACIYEAKMKDERSAAVILADLQQRLLHAVDGSADSRIDYKWERHGDKTVYRFTVPD